MQSIFPVSLPPAQVAAMHNMTLGDFQKLPGNVRNSLQCTAPYVDRNAATAGIPIDQRAFLLEQTAMAEAWWAVLDMDVSDLYKQAQGTYNFIITSASFWLPDCGIDVAHMHPLFEALVELRQLALNYVFVNAHTNDDDREKITLAVNESLQVTTGAQVLKHCFKLIECLKSVHVAVSPKTPEQLAQPPAQHSNAADAEQIPPSTG